MSRKYKFNNKNGVYFISFATVYWIDVFVRDYYFETMMSVLNYCRENKGMKMYYAKSYILMFLAKSAVKNFFVFS